MFKTVNNWICKDFIRNLFSQNYSVCINLYRNVFSQLDIHIRDRMLVYFFEELKNDLGREFIFAPVGFLQEQPLFLHQPLRLVTFLQMRELYSVIIDVNHVDVREFLYKGEPKDEVKNG